MSQSATLLGLLFAILISLVGAVLAIGSKIGQDYLAERREQIKLVSLVRGELLNIIRHCEIVRSEVKTDDFRDVDKERKVSWRKRRHGDLSFIKSNLPKLGFIEESTVAAFLQLSLFIRNNDLEIDRIIEHIENNDLCPDDFHGILFRMERRMDAAIRVSNALLSRPALYLRNREPRSVQPSVDDILAKLGSTKHPWIQEGAIEVPEYTKT